MEQNVPSRKYRSLADAAQYAGCSQRFLRRRIQAGELVSFLVSGRRFTTFDLVDRMMERNKTRHPRRGRGIRHHTTAAGKCQGGNE